MDFLSDYYSGYSFEDRKLTLEQLIVIMKNEGIQDYYIKYNFSNAKGCEFSDEFLNKLKSDETIELFPKAANVAMVNTENKNLCFKIDGNNYINSGEDLFKVIGFYIDKQDEILHQTPYYINITSSEIKDRNDFDHVIIDYGTIENQKKKSDLISKKLDAISIYNWSGNISGLINVRPVYIFVIALCALIVCLNCIGFIKIWIDSFSYEFKVRKLVGGTDSSNDRLIIKDLLIIYLIADVGALITSKILFFIIRMTNTLPNIRGLFGLELHALPFISASLSALFLVLFITVIILKINRKKVVR